ncbi:pyridine nucleotide-disulfide oxidoreductase [Marinobacter fuscus]|uniref:Pyridine nucleotide-disulfide oxidoreductase n=1 Tax=Marinobacter fuscus TaxID=2109942 RepID=A0A2T1K3G3_9GAMM|nr:FAD-dependent oxidoreductase [Marinobacter fuscus]PSF04689.1 pyridine nucleotide-disulfide oxidoreductase [Marinobacter fuscus]
MKRLVLLGAGHAHLVALKQFVRQPLPDTELVVISPSRWQYYSGMVPGWIAGHYRLEQCRIPVRPVIEAAGGGFMAGRARAINASANEVLLEDGRSIGYDFLSIDVGSRSVMPDLPPDHGLGVKPIEDFSEQWLAADYGSLPGLSVAILGGGAAGTEVAMAIAHARRHLSGTRLVLMAGEKGILPGFPEGFRKRAGKRLTQCGVEVVNAYAEAEPCGRIRAGDVEFTVDLVLAATGAQAVPFLRTSGLEVDGQGFVSVDSDHRSVSHHNVFAAGDACSRVDGQLDRSGVHAVRAGPVLAANLAAALAGQATKPFRPRRYSLYLLAGGSQWAIGSYSPLVFSGGWVWRWKDRIDRGFLAGFPGVRSGSEQLEENAS